MTGISSELVSSFGDVLAGAAIAVAVTGTVGSIVATIKSGAIKQITLMGVGIDLRAFELRPQKDAGSQGGKEEPFEAKALASYYNQALSRTNISFWFSIMFASLGFGVIAFAFLTHSQNDSSVTLLKLIGGGVIEAVAGLFFVLSNNSQNAMLHLFERLRLDRASADAREMIQEVVSAERADQLRAQLILRYAGIERLIAADIAQSSSLSEGAKNQPSVAD